MPYTITTTTTDRESHAYTVDTLDQVDQFVARIQYRESSQIIAVSDNPVTLIYAGNIKHITIDGLTKEEIAAHEQAKREQQQAAYQQAMAEKSAQSVYGNRLDCGAAINANCVTHAETALARVVR